MNARSIAALLLVLALGAVAGVWFWLRGSEGSAERAKVAALAPDTGGDSKPGAPSSEPGSFEPGELEERAAPDAVDREPSRASAVKATRPEEQSNAIWVEGRVVLRDGTPVDEEIRVEARGKRFQPGAEGRSHFATADRDGRFRVAFAEGTRSGWIELEARYLYLEEKQKVDVGDERELVVEPKLGGRLIGRALAPASLTEESTFADTFAALVSWGGSTYFRRVCALDAEGRFSFGGVPPGTDYRVQIESKIYSDSMTDPVSVSPGETTEIDLELARGTRVSGRIVGPDGEAVGGAQLRLMTRAGGDAQHEMAQSEPDGSFELSGIRPGKAELTITHDDYLDSTEELGELVAGAVHSGLVLRLARGNLLEGVVTWPDGTPADGAWVQVEQEDENENAWMNFGGGTTARCDAEGRFRFSGLADSPCKLRASARPKGAEGEEEGGIRNRRRQPAFVAVREDVQPNARGLSIVLAKGDGVRGRAVDDADQPVTRFRVAATPASDESIGGEVASLFLAEDGAFELSGLFEGEWRISAQTRGHAESKSETITVPYDGPGLVLRLPRHATVSGRVLTPAGEPVPGARVEISAPDGGARMWMGGSLSGAKADDEGAFEDDEVEPGRRKLIARAEGFGESEPLEIDVPPAGEVAGLSLMLRRGARIQGSVHPAVGDVAGRGIQITRNQGGFYKQATTDSSGRFSVEGLSPGTYTLLLQPREQAVSEDGERDWMLIHAQRNELKVEVEEGASVNVVLGAPPARAILVTGRVTQGGEPVGGRTLTWEAVGRNARNGARTEPDGSYSVTLDGPGDWSVSIGSEWNDRLVLRASVPDVDRHRHDIALPTASIAGKVVSKDGTPLDKCPVSLQGTPPEGHEGDPWRDSRGAHTDEDGSYRFEGLRAGTYALTAGGGEQWGEGGSTHGRKRFPAVTLGEGEAREGHVLELEPGGMIEGSVVDALGAPVDGAWIQILDATSGEDDPWSAAYTQEGGRFRCRGVAPGTVRVRASRGESKSALREVRVYSGESARVDLTLED